MISRKILIIEDDAALLRGLRDNFQAEGYDVCTADDGEKGLDALLGDPPDLVLLDVMLPKLNGYEICRLARSRRLRTPILMLSAKCWLDDVFRGLAVGADDYMTKPFGIHDLLLRAKRLSSRGAPGISVPPPGFGVRPSPGASGYGEGDRKRQGTGALQDAGAPAESPPNSEGPADILRQLQARPLTTEPTP